MEKRRLQIVIDKMGWHISSNQKGNRSDDELDELFAFVEVKDDKIVHLGDYWLNEEMMSLKSPLLLEESIFIHDKHSFEGNFLDALKYISDRI